MLNSGLNRISNPGGEGTVANAFRHGVWQAMIARDFGSDIAAQAGNAHEDNPFALNEVNNPEGTLFSGEGALGKADEMTDLLNNDIGRQIGSGNPNATNVQIATKVLDTFKKEGMWVAQPQKDGGYKVTKDKLSSAAHGSALKRIKNLGESGFTKKKEKSLREEQ